MKHALFSTVLRAGVLALALCCSLPVKAFTVGSNSLGVSEASTYDLGVGGFIGTNADPVPITLDATAGPWLITFTGAASPPWGAGIGYVAETLHVDSSDSWSGWALELQTTENWQFQPGSFGFLVAGSAPTNLLSTLDVTGTRVEFTFDPFPLPTMVQIAWGFVCPGPPGSCTADSFTLAQYPILAPIPEPEIYAMLGVGLALMGWVGRRRKIQVA